MIEFGTGLRKAREAKGYTIGQIAETTHISPTTINDLENEDFSHLAAPIYGRGFVKLYCEAVGLDAKPYVDEFMSIYNGERDVPIKERAPVSHETPAIPQPPANPPAESPMTPPQEVMPQEAPKQATEPVESDSLFSTQDDGIKLTQPSPMTEERPSLSRYASPLNNNFPAPKSLMLPPLWRIATLCIVALLVLWMIVMGIRSLYRATSVHTDEPAEQAPNETVAVEKAPSPKPAQAVSKPVPPKKPTPAAKPTPQKKPVSQGAAPSRKSNRQAQAIPPLYVD